MKVFDGVYSKIDRNILSHLSHSQSRELQLANDLITYYARGVSLSLSYNFVEIKEKTLDYVASNKVGDNIAEYKYCQSQSRPNLYSSCYACMIRSLYGDINNLSHEEKNEWVSYIDSFQSPEDGLFYDPALINHSYKTEDWWGARHLAKRVLGYSPSVTLKDGLLEILADKR